MILDVGEPAWATGTTAAALLGFDGFQLRSPFEILLPRGRDLERPNMRRRTSNTVPLIDRDRVDGIPVTSGARTIIELARDHSNSDLAVAIDSAIRDRLVSEDLLHRRIVGLRAKGRFGLPRLHAVLAGFEVTRGGHSWLERRFLQLCAEHGLPRPTCQVTLSKAGDELVRVDFRFEGTPVVVEVLGYRFHGAKQQSRDVARLNALLRDGYLPYQVTYGQLVETPHDVIATIRCALQPFLP